MRLLSISLTILLCAGIAAGQGPRRAPDFSLQSSDNRKISLADYRGKVVLIDIMKTDCPHCGPFAELLERVKNQYGDKIAVLSIAPAPDNAATVSKFIATNKITFPILLDFGQVTFSYIRPNPMNPTILLPRLYIVGPDGMILRDYLYGPETQAIFRGNQLFNELDTILKIKSH